MPDVIGGDETWL